MKMPGLLKRATTKCRIQTNGVLNRSKTIRRIKIFPNRATATCGTRHRPRSSRFLTDKWSVLATTIC